MAFLWWKIRTKMRGNQKLHLSHMAIILYHGEGKVLVKLGAGFQSRGRKHVGSHKYTNCPELLQSHLKLVAVFDHCSAASKVWFPCVFCKLIYHSCRRHKQPSQCKDGWKVRQGRLASVAQYCSLNCTCFKKMAGGMPTFFASILILLLLSTG